MINRITTLHGNISTRSFSSMAMSIRLLATSRSALSRLHVLREVRRESFDQPLRSLISLGLRSSAPRPSCKFARLVRAFVIAVNPCRTQCLMISSSTCFTGKLLATYATLPLYFRPHLASATFLHTDKPSHRAIMVHEGFSNWPVMGYASSTRSPVAERQHRP